ncbi:unnamed protein product [Calicophoron daubneyi]|uniref:RFX-type winged-helix domain-containing protein n=1 Tax=Calicophoron daubneyi TaxID=300641 RepID=A0AAV2T1T1_CALDB
MNPASFGKLIRSIFFGLRTRRLGTRGNSKYHYYGIRIKPNSPLNHFVEDAGFSLRHYPNYHRQTMEAAAEWKNFANSSVNRVKSSSVAPGSSGLSHSSSQNLHNQQNSTLSSSLQLCGSQHNSEKQFTSYVSNISSQCATSTGDSTAASGTVSSPALVSNAQRQHAQFLGEAISALPNLDEICRSAGLPVPGETDLNSLANDPNMSGKTKGKIGATSYNPSFCADVIKFCRLYALSARYMLDAVVNLEFTAIETEWKNFWRTEDVRDSRLQQSLSQDRLCAIVSDSAVLQFVRLYDHTFYQSLAEVLIPNVLRPIPPALTQAIRNFAKSLEGWMRQATQGLDPTLVGLKVSAVSSLAQTLRRYTSLNHLAQAARAVLKNANQINQMLTDLNRVDFNNVQEQASWVCQCNDATVSQLEQDFKRILHKHATLEEWAQWLDTVVTTILQPLEGNSLAYTRAAHQLILKWSFYSSMVIRDLTLRSAASFGSFHLIRLLYDEYIFYLVEHKVAAHLGMTPVAVMGEMGRDITQQHYAQSRLHSDLTTRRDSKPAAVVPEADDAFDTLNFNEHSGGLRDEDYLSTPNNRLPKSNDDNGAAAQNPEDDEEVDEYLDDEEDVDDSVGEEGAMLKHAHASVQAYCRSSAAVGTGKPPDAPLFTIVKTVGSEESGVIKLASDATGTATGTSQPPIATTVTSDEDNSATAEKKNEALNTDHKDIELDAKSEASPTVAASGASDTSCSPPPIVALPNPVRKVVRVTTFCDSRQSTSSSASSNLSITTTKPSERSPSGTGDVSLATTDSLHDQLPGRTNSSATFALNIDRSVANLSAVNTESTSAKRIRLT